jgi:O-antigen/teichoic acid export membrane protein
MLSADPNETSTPGAGDGLGETTGSTVIRGGLWTVLGRIVPTFQVLAISIVAARFLGPDGMGRQSFISFVASSVALLAVAGLPSALNVFFGEMLGARRLREARSLYSWTWRIELVAAAIGTAALLAVAALGADPTGAWVLAAIACGLAVMQAVPAALLAGAQQWRQATIVGVVTGALSVPATIAVLAAGGGITGFFAVEAAVVLANLIWTWVFARRVLVRLPDESVPVPRRQEFVRFAASSSLLMVIDVVVWKRSEFIFLERFSTDAEIALYSIAFAAVAGLARVPEVVAKVTIPAVATLVGAGENERIRSGFWRALRLLAFITPPLAAGALALGPAALTLAYGEDFAGAGDVLLVLLAPFLIFPMLSTANALLFALGRMRFLIAVGLAATVLNLVLGAVLVAALDAVGAALANIGSQLAAGIPALIVAVRLMRPVELAAGPLARGLLAALLTGLVAAGMDAALGGVWGVLAGVAAGVVVYLAAASTLKVLSAGDAAWLDAAVGGLGGGLVGRACRRFAAAR